MRNFIQLCLALAMYFHAPLAMAQVPDKLAGAWIVDAAATEEFVIRSRPFKDATSFMSQNRYMVAAVFEFEGDMLLVGPFPNVGEKRAEYGLLSVKGAERMYKSKNISDSEQATITVSVLDNKNISIVYPNVPEMQYLLWKRVKLDPRKKTPDDFKPEYDAFLAMLLNISKAFASDQGR